MEAAHQRFRAFVRSAPLVIAIFELGAAEPYLVKDLNPASLGSNPRELTVAGDRLFFVAGEREPDSLWTSDGTPEGTTLVHRTLECAILAPLNGRILFRAIEAVGGQGVAEWLWASDGTPEGTIPLRYFPSLRGGLTMGNHFCFSADDGEHGVELWLTDGTPEGTQLIADIIPGPEGSYPSLHDILATRVLFWASDRTHGRELWASDGTPGGTGIVADIVAGPESSNPQYSNPVTLGDQAFFISRGSHGDEIWRTDGTQKGTMLVRGIPGTVRTVDPSFFVALGNRLIFWGHDDLHGDEPWVSDGTTEGTSLLKDINPGSQGTAANLGAVLGDRLFFAADDGVHGRELWVTDGTPLGTVLFKDFVPGNTGAFENGIEWIDSAEGLLFLSVNHHIWVCDGTPEGMQPLRGLLASPKDGSCNFGLSPPGGSMASFQGRLWLSAIDDLHGGELWITDGSPEGTRLFKDLNPETDGTGSNLGGLTVVGQRVFFTARETAESCPINPWWPPPQGFWVSDGSAGGTRLVGNELGSSARPAWYARVGHQLLLSSGPRLTVSDGTAEGTSVLQDFGEAGFPRPLLPVGSKYFFVLEVPDNLPENALWVTDGTSAGTLPLGASIPYSSPPYGRISDGKRLYLVGDHWALSSDGTPDGTMLIETPAPVNSVVAAAVREAVFFALVDGAIWAWDGKEAAPIRWLGPFASAPDGLSAVGDRLFFRAREDGASRDGLWLSDGTSAGTVRLVDTSSTGPLDPGEPWLPWWPEAVGRPDHFFFLADDGEHGPELWFSDGSPGGTRLLKDIAPGAAGSVVHDSQWNWNGFRYPFELVGGRLFFAAVEDRVRGPETGLWTTDGTPEGTVPVLDPGSGESLRLFRRCVGKGGCSIEPPQIRVVGDRLLLAAWDPSHGEELWAIDLAEFPSPPRFLHRGDPNSSGTTDISDSITIFGFLFLGHPPALTCKESADANNDGTIDISDGIYLLSWLFTGGPEPAAPGPTGSPCGVDLDAAGSPGDLGCELYAPCQ